MGARRFDHWVRRFGFGKPTGVDLPGEERGLVLPLDAVLGLVDGQPADRPGDLGHADADGPGLRRDRQRRHPARAAHRRGASAGGRPPCRAGGASSRPARPRGCARCSRARSRPGGTASEVSIPRLHARGQDRHGEQDRLRPPASTRSSRYIASFVGIVARPHAEAPHRRHGRRAAGRDLRRRGGRARPSGRSPRSRSPTCASRRSRDGEGASSRAVVARALRASSRAVKVAAGR